MMRKVIVVALIGVLLACESTQDPVVEIPPKDPPPPPTEGPFLEITVPRDTSPNAALGPPIHTFHWTTIDSAETPDSVRWAYVPAHSFPWPPDQWDQALDNITNTPDAPEWHPWQRYDPANDTGTSWTTPPLNRGPWLFVLHGKMEGGAAIQEFDLARNARRVSIHEESRFYAKLTSDFMETTRSINHRDLPIIVNLPAGTPVDFCWSGHLSLNDFESFTGSYRYGWDVVDPLEESEWEVWYTELDDSERCATTRTFDGIGTHTFLLDVLDDSGLDIRFYVIMNFVEATAPRRDDSRE